MSKLVFGNPISNRKIVDTWSNYYMIQNKPFDQDINIEAWNYYGKRGGLKVQLIIYRRTGDSFSIVGKGLMTTSRVGATYQTVRPPIEAKKGDYIGWYVPRTGVIAFDVGAGGWQTPGLEKTTFFTPMGSSATNMKYSSNRVYSINVMGSPAVKKEPEIVIADIFYDGIEKTTEGDEYMEIMNNGTAPGNISGYRVNADDKGQDFTFPEGTTLEPGASVRVYTNVTDLSTGGFSFGSKRAIWNNTEGDVGRLYDASGKEIDTFGYGPKELHD